MVDERDIRALALLEEPTRRALYEWVTAQQRAVSRDEAAVGVGLSRALAAFHLDRLAELGLLEVEFRRLSGRSGPGAGRPAKLYRRAERELAVSLPQRTYDVAAEVLARAVEGGRSELVTESLRQAGGQAGRAAGAAARRDAGRAVGQRRSRTALLAALAERGYEPVVEAGEIRLRNCPFHALVAEHRETVCGMNLAISEGLLEGLGGTGLRARLAPEEGYCCVKLMPDDAG